MNRITYPPSLLKGTRTDFRSALSSGAGTQIIGADVCRSRVTLAFAGNDAVTAADAVSLAVPFFGALYPLASIDATVRAVTVLVEDVGDALTYPLFVVSAANDFTVRLISVSRDNPEA